MDPRRRRLVTLGLLVDMFLAAMESSVVGTAMPTIVAHLGGFSAYSWVFSIFLLTQTIAVPIWGRLSDAHGRRNVYLTAAVIFVVGSALSGQSRSMTELIIFRGLQGVGAGGLLPISQAIVGDIYPLEQRARMQGLFSSMWGLAAIVGPLVGGVLTDHLSWRWVFYINVPIAAVASTLIGVYLGGAGERSAAKLDVVGSVLLGGSVGALMLGLFRAGDVASFSDAGVLAWMAAAAVLFVALVVAERRATEPVLPLDLLPLRIIWSTSIASFLASVVMFGAIGFIPLFVQGVVGTNATDAGRILTPLTFGWVVFATISGRILVRVGYLRMSVAGMSLLAVGSGLLLIPGANSGQLSVLPPMIVIGAGLGVTMTAFIIAVQNGVPRRSLGVATSFTQFCRNIGGAVGLAVFGTILAVRFADAVPPGVRIGDPNAAINPATRSRLPPGALVQIRHALASSLHSVYSAGFVVALVAFGSAFLIPRGRARELAHEESLVTEVVGVSDAGHQPAPPMA